MRDEANMQGTMTKLFGFTKILGNEHVICLGTRCFIWNISIIKVPGVNKRRIRFYRLMADADYVLYHMTVNSGKYRFFGWMSAQPLEELYDMFDH